MVVKRKCDHHKAEHQIADDAVNQGKFQVSFQRIPKIGKNKRMFLPRIVPGDIGNANSNRIKQDNGCQENQRLGGNVNIQEINQSQDDNKRDQKQKIDFYKVRPFSEKDLPKANKRRLWGLVLTDPRAWFVIVE